MAVQPLNKTKIIKKIKHHPNRFQGDRFKRVGVSTPPATPNGVAQLALCTPQRPNLAWF